MSIIKYTYITLITISLIILSTSLLFAQSPKENLAKADRLMFEKQYSRAGDLYLHLLENDSNNNEIIYKYATSLRLQLNYSKAFSYYSKLLKSTEKFNTDTWFYYAKTAQQLGKYKESIYGFTEYINIGSSSYLRNQSEQCIEACKYALNHQNDSSEYTITHLPPPINTPYSEFNPIAISSNELVFSRYQAAFDDSIENVFSQTYFSDILISKQNQRGWQEAKLFSDKLSSNKYFTANICFSKNLQEIYFTRCFDDGGIIGQCAIYYSHKKRGHWSKPKKLGKVNKQNSSSTHPYLAEYEDYSVLYFSSDQPNGFGGNDIWYAIIKDGNIEQISNLGSNINTSGNELTPFYDTDQGVLFFSSDSHQGFGGFDIFKSTGGLSSWKKISNLGLPINSPANDLYYSHRRGGSIAYLSSNRKGSYYHGNAESCCSDIYQAVRQELKDSIILTETPKDSLKKDSVVIAIQKLLPLSLYFENDMPNPKSRKTSTKANYKDLLKEYITAKETYKQEYSDGLGTDAAFEAELQIEDFFSLKVEHGFEDLEKFADLLKRELGEGKTVRIKIRGYASPLNSPEYNLALSKRRIASLKNFISEYENGYFLPYLHNKADNGGQLSIYEDPLGDSQSIGLVSDNPNDKRNSVYSREAALQRKIQIIMYSSNEFNIDSADYPILDWRDTELSLGSIKKGQNKSTIVYFENMGKAELNIQNIHAECNCIQIQMDKTIYQSHDKGKFYVLLRTSDLEVGKYHIKIIVQTNEIESYQNYYVDFEIID